MVRIWLLLCTAALGFALWQDHRLPAPATLLPQLQQEPLQKPVRQAAFTEEAGGVTYQIQPLYSYEIQGLVVSRHHADSWWDWIHAANADNLNVADLCMLWGDNAQSGVYRDISFSSGQWTCDFSTSSQGAYEAFNQAQISNNHLLTIDRQLMTRIRQMRPGDQIRLKGYLAEYRHTANGVARFRGTSTVRTDTGNGACETLYVTEADILQPAPPLWRQLAWGAGIGLLLGLLAWFVSPHRSRY